MRSPDHAILNKIYNLKFDSVVNIYLHICQLYIIQKHVLNEKHVLDIRIYR